MASNIFQRQSLLKPSTMRGVADRRFDDALVLRATGVNARANGVAYLAGVVVEILLKAQLVERYPDIAKTPPHELNGLPEKQREVWRLIWRSHDLDEMLIQLPELEAALEKKGLKEGQGGYNYLAALKKICATWTIQARYSSQTMHMDEASRLLDDVRRLKESLK